MERFVFFDDICGTVVALSTIDNPDLIQRWVIRKQLSGTYERLPEADMP